MKKAKRANAGDARTERLVLYVRVTKDEHDRFTDLCKRHDLAQADAIRRLIRQASALGPTLDGESAYLVRELANQTRHIGVNINQWTRAMHLGLVPLNSEVKTWITRVAELLDRYEGMLFDLCSKRAKIAAVALADQGTEA